MHKPVLQILKTVPVFILSLGLAFPQAAGGTSYVITTVAGTGDIRFQGDGESATAASLSFPSDVIFDDVGNLYIADQGHRRIRLISPAGVVTTFAGSDDLQGYSGDGGPATAARLSNPTGLALDTAGNLFIADSYNHCIRKVDRGGIITTFAGTCTLKGFSGDGGPATSA